MWDSFKTLWDQPEDFEEKRDIWFQKMKAWGFLNGVLTFLSIMFPAIVTVSSATYAPWLAVAATVTSGMIGALNARDRKDQFNTAWWLLARAIQDGDPKEIKAADARGESIINADALQKYAPDVFVGPQRKEPPKSSPSRDEPPKEEKAGDRH